MFVCMRMNIKSKLMIIIILLAFICACNDSTHDSSQNTISPDKVQIDIDTNQRQRVFLTIGQQLDDYYIFDKLNGQPALSALSPDWFRIHAGADNDILPEPIATDGLISWRFDALDRLVKIAYDANATPIINVRHAPASLSSCQLFHSGFGKLNDPTYAEFADYMSKLVSYYNLGKFSDSTGTYINPWGISHRVEYWEIWNEPELPYEFPCLRSSENQASLSESEFAAMWAITTQRMRSIDPSIKFVGPVTSDPRNLSYLKAIYNLPFPPDVISFHGYAGSNSSKDEQLQKGGGDAIGITGISLALENILLELKRLGLQNTPIFLDEYNVSPDGNDDLFGRGWNNFGVALGGSLFIKMAKISTDIPLSFMPFQFVEMGGQRLSSINPETGEPLLPYWRDQLLRRAVKDGDNILKTLTTKNSLDVLTTIRANQTTVNVLIAHSNVTTEGVGTQGDNIAVTVNVPKLMNQLAKSIIIRKIDATTNPALGFDVQDLDPTINPTVNFKGYGLALIEINY